MSCSDRARIEAFSDEWVLRLAAPPAVGWQLYADERLVASTAQIPPELPTVAAAWASAAAAASGAIIRAFAERPGAGGDVEYAAVSALFGGVG